MSLMMFQPPPPSLLPKPKSQMSTVSLKKVPVWCSLTRWGKTRTRACPLILNRLGTELPSCLPQAISERVTAMPGPGCSMGSKGAREKWLYLPQREKARNKQEETAAPRCQVLKYNDTVKTDNGKPLLFPRGQGVETGAQKDVRPFLLEPEYE